MTPREAFDIAVTGVLKQGKASTDGENASMYRGLDGCKCPAGFLLTDKQAAEAEGRAIGATTDDVYYRPKGWNDETIRVVRGLQFAHDEAAGEEDFIGEFRRNVRYFVASKRDWPIPEI